MTERAKRKFEIQAEELNRLYTVEGKSAVEIAKIYGIKSHKTITSYLKQFGIKLRNRSEALITANHGVLCHKPITDLEKEILIGEMLGDGNITLDSRNTGDCLPYYRHTSSMKEYLEWMASIMPSLNWANVVAYTHNKKGKDGNHYISYRLRSFCHPDLMSLFKMFYNINENGEPIKHVPNDLVLTPRMLRHWFIGDGTAGYYSCGKRNGIQRKTWQIMLYTYCFTESDIERLIKQLETLGIKGEKNRKKAGICIRISAESYDKFYELVGPCPIECYSYKWRENNEDYLEAIKREYNDKKL